VNIPGCFAADNARRALGLFAGFQQYFTSTNAVDRRNNASARRCVACGACVKKCPQRIDIPAQLAGVSRRFEPLPLRVGLELYGKLQ
jgi:predicted aldo/keto reductase-like oxidoreductase